MIKYEDILFFRDQHIVDELYQKLKTDNDNEELEKAYQQISTNNQTQLHTFLYQYRQIMTKIYSVWNVISWLLFAILFIVSGSMICATGVAYLFFSIDFFKGIYQLISEIGVSLLEGLFRVPTETITYFQQVSPIFLCIVGLTFLFIVLFTTLYIISLFKKDHQKQTSIQMSLDDCYHSLQCCQDDSWDYIRQSFEKRIHTRRNHHFFERYYYAYIKIAQNHELVEGTVQDLTTKEQIILYIRTFTNSIKNIFGAFSMPIYISTALLISYYRSFQGVSILRLKDILEYIPLGDWIYSLLDFCYGIVSHFPLFYYFEILDLEFVKVISFCICLTIVWGLYTIIKTRISEIKRQYLRRQQFYLKKHQGLYASNEKFPKVYQYSVQWTVFVVFVCIAIGLWQAFLASFPYDGEAVFTMMKQRQVVLDQMQPYVEEKNHILGNWEQRLSPEYIAVDSLTDMEKTGTYNNPYLRIYTYYAQEDATKAFEDQKDSYDHYKKKEDQLQLAYSSKGFMIVDHGIVMKMSNSSSLLQQTLSQEDITTMIKQIGYTIE
ncbi:hypothetical protein [Massilimicrobiota sp. An134]|uniref:hypothetical protein n=1 Tax=Massilimicrobiota sp. An134 TaxID=1965557 RepID=UPI000B372B83|nr:hypothetical protein [Massilimicrobiota sp. An134]OUQ30949.1 hypothetical protein B5E79_01870 [Massilimicrobiota sp. An134]